MLHEIIGHKQVRLEAAGAQWRVRGEREGAGPDGLSQGWHNGGPGAYTNPIMGYHYKNGVIHAGMIRVIFELGDVKQADGATHFITGSRPPSPLLRLLLVLVLLVLVLALVVLVLGLLLGCSCPCSSGLTACACSQTRRTSR